MMWYNFGGVLATFIAILCFAAVIRSFIRYVFLSSQKAGVRTSGCPRCRHGWKRGPFCSHCGYCHYMESCVDGTFVCESNGHRTTFNNPPPPRHWSSPAPKQKAFQPGIVAMYHAPITGPMPTIDATSWQQIHPAAFETFGF